MLANLPARVKIVEVGMRDGLQNEKEFIPTAEKVKLVDMLSQTGLDHIEVTSFVSPKWIPQLADSQEVLRAIRRRADISYTALVPNLKVLEAAKTGGLDEIAFFLSASEGHSKKNINKSIAEAMESGKELIEAAFGQGLKVRTYLSTVFGCPFDGKTDPHLVSDLCHQLLDLGVYEISLGDTIGIANPKQVEELLQFLTKEIESRYLAVHFHDTRGLGIANALAALANGITTFDTSFGGLGGCPFAPGASGNVATEDLVYMFHSMGIDTGVNLDELARCSQYAEGILQRGLPSKYLKTISRG